MGKKDPNEAIAAKKMHEEIAADLANGAFKVIVEARESGMSVGIYDDGGRVVEQRLNELLAGIESIDRVIWEAPLPHQQEYFVVRFGPNVNLGNVRPNDVLALEALRCGLRFETLRRYVEQAEH